VVEFDEWHRKSFKVRAVQVTEENMVALAQLCGGEYRETIDIPGWNRNKPKAHIYLPKGSGTGGHRQTMAFVGDWILTTNRISFRIYADKAFRGVFESPEEKVHREHHTYPEVHARNHTVLQLVMRAMQAQASATFYSDSQGDMDLMAKQTSDEILKLFAA
jgi:hypothetical protein